MFFPFLPWQLAAPHKMPSSSSPPMSSLFLLLLLAAADMANGAKILFTFYHDRGSHFGSMLPMMEKLAQRHSVSALYTISDSPPASLAFANIRPLIAPLPAHKDGLLVAEYVWNRTVNNLAVFMVWMDGHRQMGQFGDLHQQKVVEMVDEEWDLIVMDDLFWCFGFALSTLKQRLWEKGGGAEGRPAEPRTIVYATAGQTLLSAESIKATSRNWVSKAPLFPYIPTDRDDVFSPSRFLHRLFAFYENMAEHVLMNILVEPLFLPNIARFGVPNFSWYEMYRRSAMQYSDSIDRLGWPLAQGPEMVNVGAHCKEAKRMPEEFRKFIEDPQSKGTIYAAFGTYPDWNLAPPRILSALIDAFQRLPSYRIIFAYNGPPIPAIGRHILLTKWAPQLEILAHPRTKAYITHGGLKSIREGLCAAVPLIVMPLFAEQAHNAHLVLAMGIGPVINKYTLTTASVQNTIEQIVSNPESAVRAERFRAIYLDRPMPALDEGAFWVDRLMRLQPGRRANFVRKGMDMGWAQFAYADLAALLLLMTLVMAKS